MTYNEAVKRIRSLLATWLQAGVDLFIELKNVDESGVWRTPENATFGDFLSREFPDALGLNRYENVINAIQVYGEDFVRKVGVESCHALTNQKIVRNEGHRTEVKRSVEDHIKVNQVAPTPAEIRKITRGITREPSPVADSTRRVRLQDDLAQEVQDLRSKLRAANKRIRELEKELARFKKPERQVNPD